MTMVYSSIPCSITPCRSCKSGLQGNVTQVDDTGKPFEAPILQSQILSCLFIRIITNDQSHTAEVVESNGEPEGQFPQH